MYDAGDFCTSCRLHSPGELILTGFYPAIVNYSTDVFIGMLNETEELQLITKRVEKTPALASGSVDTRHLQLL